MSKIIVRPRFAPGTQPESLYPPYRSTVHRAPERPLIFLPHTLSERTGPVYGHNAVAEGDNDLTRHPRGEPQGQRIIVTGRVTTEKDRPLRNTLIELWQANAGGRYLHRVDNHPAPIDPHFTGAGRTLTDDDGNYRFITIKPGCYPWENHTNAWRPAHIHLSLVGPSLVTRLITQMYFPDDPLFPFDPIFQSIRDEKARQRLISTFDLQATVPNWALAFRFNIVLRGPDETPFEE